MPSNWLAMDDNFPTFTGSESPQQQIAALHDYLFQMRQGLQYSMRNLTAENFNASALQQLTDEQKDAFAKELQVLINTVNQFATDLSNLNARVLAVEKLGARVTSAEEEISYLQKDVDQLQEEQAALDEQMTAAQESIDGLEQDLNGEDGIIKKLQTVQTEQERFASVVREADDGSTIIGGEGEIVHLVGQIYINGQLYESGGEAT